MIGKSIVKISTIFRQIFQKNIMEEKGIPSDNRIYLNVFTFDSSIDESKFSMSDAVNHFYHFKSPVSRLIEVSFSDYYAKNGVENTLLEIVNTYYGGMLIEYSEPGVIKVQNEKNKCLDSFLNTSIDNKFLHQFIELFSFAFENERNIYFLYNHVHFSSNKSE